MFLDHTFNPYQWFNLEILLLFNKKFPWSWRSTFMVNHKILHECSDGKTLIQIPHLVE